MSQTTIDGVQNVFEDCMQFIDESSIIYSLLLRKFEFDMNYINKSRAFYYNNIVETCFKTILTRAENEKMKLMEDSKSNRVKRDDLKRNSYFNMCKRCNEDWPLCIYDTYYKYDITNFFIFQTQDPPKLIENYFFSSLNENFSNKSCIGSTNSSDGISLLNKDLKRGKKDKIFEENKITEDDSCRVEEGGENNFSLVYKSNSSVDDSCFSGTGEISEEENEKILKIKKSTASKPKSKLKSKFLLNNRDGEFKKNQNFRNMIIERRMHFCRLFSPKGALREFDSNLISKNNPADNHLINFSDSSDSSSTENNLRRTIKYRYTKNKNIHKKFKFSLNSHSYNLDKDNKSFTAFNPYLTMNVKNEDNQLMCSNFISCMRKTCQNTQKNVFDNLRFEVSPFKDDDFLQMEEEN
jgi:hypothetical protein